MNDKNKLSFILKIITEYEEKNYQMMNEQQQTFLNETIEKIKKQLKGL